MGTLTKSKNGLILDYGFETGPEGWTEEDTGTSDAIWPQNTGSAHEGSLVLRLNSSAASYASIKKTIDVGTEAAKRISAWKMHSQAGSGTFYLIVGSTMYSMAFSGASGWAHTGWKNINSENGSQLVRVKALAGGAFVDTDVDKLVIMAGDSIVVTGLAQGNKIEVYNSDNTLFGSDTAGPGETECSVNVESKTDLPFQGYLKIYDTNGTTLLYTSPTQPLCGGDTFAWSAGVSYILGPASNLRIYKSGAVATPKSVSITFTLKNAADDAVISGKIISFSTCLGTVSPTSALTDGNGQASTTLTSESAHGWAVVKGAFAGDIAYGASAAYVEVAVYDEADSGDSSKPYQVFVHGTQYAFCGGSYKKSVGFQPQEFTVELKQVESAIDGALEVIIYRRGVKDFVGRIRKPVATMDDLMIIPGVSNHWKLLRRTVNKTDAPADPKTILEALLTRYPAGVAAGTIQAFNNNIAIPFDYDSFLSAIQRLLDATGWYARLNLDDTLDFNSSFGTVKEVSFLTGCQNCELTREDDYTPLITRSVLIGDTLSHVSDKDNPAQAALHGLIEKVFVDKNLSTQATLDIQNQKTLDSKDDVIERISGTVVDLDYAADAYDVFDSVTVTDVKTGLSGTYQVISIERDLRDSGIATIQLSNVALDFQDQLSAIERTVKDLST